VHQHLQHPVRITQDRAPGQLPVPRHPHLEGHLLGRQLAFRPADVADLQDGVDPDGLQVAQLVADRFAEGVVGRPAALLHRGGGQRREPDDVPDGVDVFDLGLEVFVDLHPAAVAGVDPGGRDIQLVGGALPAGGVQHGVGGDLLARFQDGHMSPRSTIAARWPNLAAAMAAF